ncbi:hypothetical protein DCOP10_123177 [Armatimonadetes bacterium DC]|nr:hypothetical protein DCOP10_123177 [Armatimonadetes bacterium DC]
MARSWESVRQKISLTQGLLQEVGLSLEAIIGRICRVEMHWPFGGKPAIRLNLNLLRVQFLPIREFPKGLPFVEST